MHISPINYSSFALAGQMLYEFSRKVLLEKVISSFLFASLKILYLSIAYFTMATEMRFVEIDKHKSKSDNYNKSS